MSEACQFKLIMKLRPTDRAWYSGEEEEGNNLSAHGHAFPHRKKSPPWKLHKENFTEFKNQDIEFKGRSDMKTTTVVMVTG